MTDSDITDGPVLRVSEEALAIVTEARAAEPQAESLALWVETNGSSGHSFNYEIYFQAATDARDEDSSSDQGGLTVVVPAESIADLRGAVLDTADGGLVIENPNRPPEASGPSPAMGPPPDLSGDVAQRIVQVLELQVNPSIAAHGGRAELVAVQEDAAYLRLSGGCAGCGMAQVTLSQGIEVAIRESVPEIVRVVDVTDHAAGTNPYFESAKK